MSLNWLDWLRLNPKHQRKSSEHMHTHISGDIDIDKFIPLEVSARFKLIFSDCLMSFSDSGWIFIFVKPLYRNDIEWVLFWDCDLNFMNYYCFYHKHNSHIQN